MLSKKDVCYRRARAALHLRKCLTELLYLPSCPRWQVCHLQPEGHSPVCGPDNLPPDDGGGPNGGRGGDLPGPNSPFGGAGDRNGLPGHDLRRQEAPRGGVCQTPAPTRSNVHRNGTEMDCEYRKYRTL